MPEVNEGRCINCNKADGICTPVMTVPVRNYPLPLYLQFRGTICQKCANGFTMKTYTDYMGSWYDMACDHLRSVKKPAVNPYPNDPDFKWEEFIIKPDWEPVPMEECVLKFWRKKSLAAKSMTQSLGPLKGR